jgi:N utilization substance protein B
MKVRTYARHLALKVIYQNELVGTPVEEAFSSTLEIDERNIAPDAFAFSRELVAGVAEHKQHIDGKLAMYIDGKWTLGRLGKLETIILRLATYEILYIKSIPCRVSIDEAVEMSKIYLGAEAARLINGVLHRIAKSADPDGLTG